MAWFSSKVEVTFIDDATGESFGVTEMPPADLPESFELDTTLHLGNEDWSVVDAQPKTRAEYAKSKTLTLRLRRVEMMDPSKILYSLPSICDAIPSVNDHPLSGNEFVLAEDDWRQFELVSNDHARDVDEEIEKIRLIHENASAEVGWRKIHVRSKPDLPIVCTLGLADLADTLNVPDESVGVTYRGAQSQIADGYAFRTNDLTLYGVAPNGNVQTIAFDQYSDVSPTSDAICRLKSLAQNLDLDLVYWCRCARAGPDDPLFDSLLANDAT
jgi:hypothetical protein